MGHWARPWARHTFRPTPEVHADAGPSPDLDPALAGRARAAGRARLAHASRSARGPRPGQPDQQDRPGAAGADGGPNAVAASDRRDGAAERAVPGPPQPRAGAASLRPAA